MPSFFQHSQVLPSFLPSFAQGSHNSHGGSQNQPPSASPMIAAAPSATSAAVNKQMRTARSSWSVSERKRCQTRASEGRGSSRLELCGERQKVGGPVLAAIGHTPRRTTRGINRLKGSVADLLQPAIFRPPTFWRSPKCARGFHPERSARRRESGMTGQDDANLLA